MAKGQWPNDGRTNGEEEKPEKVTGHEKERVDWETGGRRQQQQGIYPFLPYPYILFSVCVSKEWLFLNKFSMDVIGREELEGVWVEHSRTDETAASQLGPQAQKKGGVVYLFLSFF